MRLTKLSALGLKGLTFRHDLSAVNMIVGANYRGKTSRLDAVRLVLMGHLPELGKATRATLELAGNGSLEVSAETSDGGRVVRTWKGGKATVTGELGETPTVLLNSAEYFEMGDKDRIRYVFGLAKVEAPEFTADAIIAAIKSIRVENHSEQHEKVIQQQVGLIDDSDRARHENGVSIQDWVEALCVEMRSKLALARAGQKRMAETVRGQTTLTAGDDAQTRDCEAELKQATEAVGVLRGTIDGLTRDIRRLDGVARNREVLEQRIAGATDLKEAIEQAERGMAELQAKCDAHKSQHAEIAAKLRKASDEQAGARSNVEQTSKEIARLRSEHTANLSAKECPHCGTRKAGWQDSIVAKFEARFGELNQKLLDAEYRLQAARKTVGELEANLKTAIAADDDNDKRLRELSRLQATVNTMRRQQSDLDQARATLAGIEPVAPGAVEALNTQIADKTKEAALLSAQVGCLTDRQRQYVQWRQDEARNAQAILAGLEVGAEVEVLKAVVAILEALQVAMVKKAFETILERANQVTKGIMLTPLEYHDGEIGRFQGGQWISHRTFSGTEKALCYAGISVALAWDAPIKIVLMDELGRMDVSNQNRLIERMVYLTGKGIIDQFIGAATELAEDVEVSVNLIRL